MTAEQGTNSKGAKRESSSTHAFPALFDLEADPGETNNLAGAHPDIVAELQRRIAAVDKDLGVTQKSGPGVRSCGRVPKAGPPPKK